MSGSGTGRGHALRRVFGAAVALLSLSWVPAHGQELHGLFTGSTSATTSESSQGTRAEFQNTREAVDLNWNKPISPTLGYRLSLRSERVDSTSSLSGAGQQTTTDSSSLLVQPVLDVTLASPGYTLSAGLRLRELFTEEDKAEEVTLSERTAFARFSYSPEQLPSVALMLEQSTSADDRSPQTRDETDTRYQLSSQYTLGGLANLAYNFSRQVHEDHLEARTQTQDTHTGSAGFAQKFLGDTLSVQADLSLNYSKTLEEFFVPGTAEIGRTLASGLRAGPDASPANSADVPLVTEPALLSGAANVPLTLLSAIGFGLVAPETVSEIEISLAAEPPFVLPATLTSSVTIRVFSTDDPTLVTWTEAAGVAGSFDPLQNRLTLTFASTTARFFKAYVSRNDFGALLKATGIAAPRTTTVVAGTTLSRSTSGGTVSAGLSYTPIQMLTAAYNVSLTQNTQDPEAIESTSGSHSFSLTARPHRLVNTAATYQYSWSGTSQAGAQDTTQTSYTLSAGWTPLQTLSTTLTLARNESEVAGVLESRSDTASLGAAAKVFPGLNLDSSFALSRAQSFTSEQEIVGQDALFRATAQITPWISTVGNYGIQIRETTPAPAGSDAVAVTHSVGGGTVYTLSRLVNFTTRFDYVASPDGSSLSQQYKVDWVPTSKTSFFVSYGTTQQHMGEIQGGSDTITLNGRWSINRAVDLSADYSFSRTTSGTTSQEVQSMSASASLRF
ncbi:MAG: hypothetical protein HYV93_20710 [Candidatus Rokubacteria bacterium]|nr:hypothetical protein [Candidatus Rokubacteria bacterium]